MAEDWKKVFERSDDVANYRVDDGWLTAEWKNGGGISLGYVGDDLSLANGIIRGWWAWYRKKGPFPKLNYDFEAIAKERAESPEVV
jgi:hypothetical protein